MKPDIDCLKNLTLTQLHQLRVFIETLGYRKAAERASQEFDRLIHKTALQRFMRRAAPAEFLEDSPENDDASRQILKFAADGQPDFTAATLRALEQLAFQLTLTCTAIDDDMNALTKICTMLCRFRNASVRERMALVQEGKLKLRQQQLEKSENKDDDAKIQRLNERIADAFRLHPALTAIRDAEEAGYSFNPNPTLNPNPNPPPDSDSDSAPEPSTVPPKTKNPEPNNDEQASASELSESESPISENARSAQSQCQMKNAQFSMLNENSYENTIHT